MNIQHLFDALRAKYGSSFYQSVPDSDAGAYPCTVFDFNGSAIHVSRIDEQGNAQTMLAYEYVAGPWEQTLSGLLQ